MVLKIKKYSVYVRVNNWHLIEEAMDWWGLIGRVEIEKNNAGCCGNFDKKIFMMWIPFKSSEAKQKE